jgi:hypothetical protein
MVAMEGFSLCLGGLAYRFQAKKSPTVTGWAFDEWWSWGDLNPRPQALFGQIYMFSGLI